MLCFWKQGNGLQGRKTWEEVRVQGHRGDGGQWLSSHTGRDYSPSHFLQIPRSSPKGLSLSSLQPKFWETGQNTSQHFHIIFYFKIGQIDLGSGYETTRKQPSSPSIKSCYHNGNCTLECSMTREFQNVGSGQPPLHIAWWINEWCKETHRWRIWDVLEFISQWFLG